MRRRIILAVVAAALLLTVAGFAAILIGHNRQKDYNDQQKWPTVQADVLKAEVQSAEAGKCDVHIIYSYSVNGTSYTNDDVTSDHPQACSPAQDRVNAYDENTSVTVRYNPDHPQHSFVEAARTAPGSAAVKGGRVLMVLGGVGTLGAAAWFWSKRGEQ